MRFSRSLMVSGAALAIAARALRRRSRRQGFAGSSVIITGGSRGLGLEMARQLAGEGARLTLLARSEDELNQAAAVVRDAGGTEVLTIACDVTNEAEVQRAFDTVAQQRGTVDCLINNAGTIKVGPLAEMTVDDFRELMNLHFWGALHTSLAAIPLMKKAGAGRIVNIASVGGRVAIPHLAPYCASKFALIGLSDAMRNELRKENIFVTTVAPGLMRTGSHVHAEVEGQKDKEYAWFATSAQVPGLAMEVKRAARRILDAVRHCEPSIDLGVPARVLNLANTLVPDAVAEAMSLATRVLPDARPVKEPKARSLEQLSPAEGSTSTTLN